MSKSKKNQVKMGLQKEFSCLQIEIQRRIRAEAAEQVGRTKSYSLFKFEINQ